MDKNIIDVENYLDNNMVRDNNNLVTDWKSLYVKLQNYEKNAEKFIEKLFANVYKNDKLV